MTRRIMHDLGCTCGRHFRRALFHSLDVGQQPGLRYAVLGDKLNLVQCPSCERMAHVSLPFLYRDMGHGQFIYVYPAEAEEQADELRGQLIEVVQDLAEIGLPTDSPSQPTLMFGLDRLAEAVAEHLTDEEEPGAISFDVRPGKKPEYAARLIAGRVALQAGGYVHSWREGGRLHLQILGPRLQLESMSISIQ